jgi:hypothetical protein
LFSKQSQTEGFLFGRLCRLVSGQPSPISAPAPTHTQQGAAPPAPVPGSTATRSKKGEKERERGLEPLSGSYFSLFVLKNFLGESVPLAIWEMQSTARGCTASHLPTTVTLLTYSAYIAE